MKLTALAATAALVATAPVAHATPQGLDITKHGVVVSSSLPHCKFEDGSGGPRPCTWNIGHRADGNGIGLAYWIGKHGHTHYVWATSPRTGEWRWVSREMADALAEGEHPEIRWERCVHRPRHNHPHQITIKCANGRTYTA